MDDASIVLPPGLGSIYFRKDTGKWQALRPPKPGVKRDNKAFETKTEAAMWLIGQYNVAKAEEDTSSAEGGVKFCDAVVTWNEERSAKKGTKDQAKNGLIKEVTAHKFSAVAMGDLQPKHVSKVLDDMAFGSRKLNVGRQLSAFCGWAYANGYTKKHLFLLSEGPSILSRVKKRSDEWRRESTDVVWTPDEIMLFIDAEEKPYYKLAFALLAVSGARCGDVVGLEWNQQNLNDMHPWGWFQKNVTTTNNDPSIEEVGKGGQRRRVYYGCGFATYLRRAQDEQRAYREDCPNWAGDWVVDRRLRSRQTMGRFGLHLSPGSLENHVTEHAARIGLTHAGGPHVFRRSLSTLADDLRYTKSMRLDVLGHKPGVADNYVKQTPEKRHEFAEHVSKLLLPSYMLE